MKNSIIIIIACTFLTIQLQAQYSKPNRVFESGQADFQASVGLVPTFFKDEGKAVVIPLSAAVDYYLTPNFTLGLQAGYSVTDGAEEIFTDGLIGQWRNTYSEIGLRIGAHLTKVQNWDFYGGLVVGATHTKVEALKPGLEDIELHKGIKPSNLNLLYSAFLGTKYALNKNWTVFSELGFGVSLVRIGVGHRLF